MGNEDWKGRIRWGDKLQKEIDKLSWDFRQDLKENKLASVQNQYLVRSRVVPAEGEN